MQSIAALLDSHRSETAWIFGKGPGLDICDLGSIGSLRICINESALVVPKPTCFFAHDEQPIKRVAAGWPAGCLAILQSPRAELAVRCGIPTNSIFTYEKRQREPEILDWSAEKIATESTLLGLTGTVHSALHFCKLIGVVSIVFVGMNGGGGYARCIGQDTPLGGGQHNVIRKDSIYIVKRLGLDFRFLEEAQS